MKNFRDIFASPGARAALALALILIIGICFNGGGAFFKWGTHRDMFRQAAVAGLLACGMTVVIVSGGIDLAVGSVLGLSAVLFSKLTLHMGWAAFPALLVTVLTGVACGASSGALTALFRIQPFIATLAMMVFARGFAKFLSGGQKISQSVQLSDGSFAQVPLPAVFEGIDQKIMGGNLAIVTLILGVFAFACWLVLTRLRYGRYLYATGGNEAAARLSGVPIVRAKLLAYCMTGLAAAIAGICQAAQEQQGDPEAGAGYELTAIAMVVIGGTSLAGGRGGIALTLLGILTIGYLEKILSLNAVGEASRLMLTGTIIVAAVLLQSSKLRRSG